MQDWCIYNIHLLINDINTLADYNNKSDASSNDQRFTVQLVVGVEQINSVQCVLH